MEGYSRMVKQGEKQIVFTADQVKINGPLVGGNINITFSTGEYAWDQVKNLPNLNGQNMEIVVYATK